VPESVIHHSDRGRQYLSIHYTERLIEADFNASVGSVGDSYDNAMVESINSRYKAGVIHKEGSWRGVDDVERATLTWVEWLNQRRRRRADSIARALRHLFEPLDFIAGPYCHAFRFGAQVTSQSHPKSAANVRHFYFGASVSALFSNIFRRKADFGVLIVPVAPDFLQLTANYLIIIPGPYEAS